MAGGRARRFFDWGRRVTWGVVAIWLGVRASHLIYRYYGGSHWPPSRLIAQIVALAIATGALGGAFGIARNWEEVAFGVIGGTIAWTIGFVEAIPTTYAVCGADAASDCEHVAMFWFAFVAAASLLPVAAGLVSASPLAWRLAPTLREAPIAGSPRYESPPGTTEQVAWARHMAGLDEDDVA